MSQDSLSNGDTQLEFTDAFVVETTADEVWSFISDPENLANCVPGADEIERLSERHYRCEITKGMSHLTISLSGEVELVELNEPAWIVAKGTAYDSTTGTDFEGLAAMEMFGIDDETTELSYTAELSFTGGLASLGARIVRKVIASDVQTYFDNVKNEVEADGTR